MPHNSTTDPAEYFAWHSMIRRCQNPTHKFYHRYGGRGITVCQRWADSFQHFMEDMGPRPSEKHSLDRIDNDGNYHPGNCRWATRDQQHNNTSVNVRITYNDQTLTLSQWARKHDMSIQVLKNRIDTGWSIEDSLTVPVGSRRSGRVFYTVQGETLSLTEWTRRTKLRMETIQSRIKRGWPVEKALTTPARKFTRRKPS